MKMFLFTVLAAMLPFTANASVVQPNDTIYPLVSMTMFDYCPPYAAKRGDCTVNNGYVPAQDEFTGEQLMTGAILNAASDDLNQVILGARFKTCWTLDTISFGRITSCSTVQTQDILLDGDLRAIAAAGGTTGQDPVTGRTFKVSAFSAGQCILMLTGDFTETLTRQALDITYYFNLCSGSVQ